jgi:hypothetical protein
MRSEEMTTATAALRQVTGAAEKIKNDETAAIGTVSRGDVIRQGDLYIVAVGFLPATMVEVQDRQLAPGSSQGSRHTLRGECRVFKAASGDVAAVIREALPKADVPIELIGPVFRTIGEVELQHPEHGNRVIPAGECFAVVYQRQHAEEVRRVLD